MWHFSIFGAKNGESEDYGIPVYAEMMRKEPDTTTSNHGTPYKGLLVGGTRFDICGLQKIV